MVAGLLTFIIGIVLTFTIIGAIIGVPLIILGVVLFLLGIIIPGRIMMGILKTIFKICLVILVVMGISLFFNIGKDFWYGNVITPVLKPFSDSCGRENDFAKRTCGCDGTQLKEVLIGSVDYYCYGQCGECACYQYNQSISNYSQVECSNPNI